MTTDATAGLSEAELRRTFEEAQRQADTVFAQYQLSQLLALGGELPLMTASVIGELVRASDAVAGAIWLAEPGEGELRLAATDPDLVLYPGGPTGWSVGEVVTEPGREGDLPANVIPGGFVSAAVARAWTARHGWHGVSLDERRDVGDGTLGADVVGYLALCPAEGHRLPPDRIRLLALVRHELAIAFRAAQLREALAGEQALLAAILDGASEGIVAVDDERRVVRANRAAEALLGQRAPAGATCEAVLGCREDGRLRCGETCRVQEVLASASGVAETELEMPVADGGSMPVAASFSAMRGPEGGAVVVLRDLRAERAAEELRASFLAAVSHELRTPLALISGHVDSLLDLGLDPAAQRRSVERIGTAAARLQALVDELLDLTQLEHASLALHRSRVDVAELLDGVIGGLGEWPGMPPATVDVPAGLPAVHVDAVRIGHVVVNLVDNARRYGGPGLISIAARRGRGSRVVVTVEDQGPGVPADERELVFDRMYRGSAARAAHPHGTGLGLYVCRRLVEAHGGTIWIEPEPGRSAISFSLPVARRAAGASSSAATPSAAS